MTIKRKNRAFSVILALVLAMAVFTSPVSAANGPTFENKDAAKDYVLEEFTQSEPNIDFTLKISKLDPQEFAIDIWDYVFAEDADDYSLLGDYYSWNSYHGYSGSFTSRKGFNNYTYNFNFDVDYKTTETQEKEFEVKLTEVMASLELEGKTRYQKVKAIYDYICDNVTYDDINPDTYTVKYTAYGALVKGTAVCQGYACLFYRMCKAASVPVRIITGTSEGEGHAWNIVKIGSYYYNVDATWDADRWFYNYFLKSDANFEDHTRDAEFDTDEFYEEHPMAPINYNKFVIAKPSLTTTRNTATSVKVVWKAVSGADGYAVYRSKSLNGTYKKIKTINDGQTTQFINKKLAKKTTYYYKVRAYDTIDNKLVYSLYSSKKSVKL